MASSTLIKVYVLVWLVLQNSVHALLLRYSRVRDVPEMYVDESFSPFFVNQIKEAILRYFSTVAVFWTEV
jgi:hypothetical protein